jgi:hypothetical protein
LKSLWEAHWVKTFLNLSILNLITVIEDLRIRAYPEADNYSSYSIHYYF